MGPFALPEAEIVRRAEVALAELGYSNCGVEMIDHPVHGRRYLTADVTFPAAVWWTARSLAGDRCPCWSCWVENSDNMQRSINCADGDCASSLDDPKSPPRELLVARV